MICDHFAIMSGVMRPPDEPNVPLMMTGIGPVFATVLVETLPDGPTSPTQE